MSNHRLRESTRAHFTYRGAQLNEISFPLGGIGSGSIGLAGNGRLIDWEIFNRPNKGSVNGFSHFAVKAERGGEVVDARVLHGDLTGPLSGSLRSTWLHSFGFGPTRASLGGLPHFAEVEFEGTFPVATLSFADDKFPGAVSLRACNPFIPGNSDDSSIPAACFTIRIANTSDDDLDYTVALAVTNPAGPGKSVNRAGRDGAVQLLTLGSSGIAADHPRYGDLTAATDCADVSLQEYWFRGMWFDDLTIYWHDFTTPGGFANRSYPEPTASGGGGFGRDDTGVLAARIGVAAGQTRSVRFVLAWSFPNCVNYWHPVGGGQEQRDQPPPELEAGEWRNYYATRFADSAASAGYCLREWQRLHGETLAFRDALYASSVPPAVLDAAAATLSVLNSPTVLRLEDGTFYGFEGLRVDQGCCEGSCTHVWNYAYALPFLFPDLERSMRDADFRYNAAPDGGMTFRLQLPLGRERLGFRACADGQFGGVIKTYREWKISGDSEWLRGHWQTIKNNIAFAWADSNPDRWDANRDGVLEGRQHHTLDMELFGPNSWLNGFYLAALAAGAEMADHFGETDTAADYRALFARGKAWTDRHLFNGEYYQQNIDLTDRSILEVYAAGDDQGELPRRAQPGVELLGRRTRRDQVPGGGGMRDRPGAGAVACQHLRHRRGVRPRPDPHRPGGDLPPQLQALVPGTLQPGAAVRAGRRGRHHHLLLPARAAGGAGDLRAGEHARLRIPGRRPHDPGGHVGGGTGDGAGGARPLRRQQAQPLERDRVRQQLRALDGRFRAAVGLLRVRVRCRARPYRLQPQGGGRAVHCLLEPGLRLGHLHPRRHRDPPAGGGRRAAPVQLRQRPPGRRGRRRGDRRAGGR